MALAIEHYAVPAFVTDRLNRIVVANREFRLIIGDPVREGVGLNERFIPALMLGAYRDHFPRREDEIAACLPGIEDEVARGNLSPGVLVLVTRTLAADRALRRRVMDGQPGWDGTVVLSDREGRRLRVREVVIPLAGDDGYHLSQWIPAPEGTAVVAATHALTPRQVEIARLFASGLRSREVAERAGISVRTARDHLEAIYDRLGIHSRAELAAIMLRETLA